MILAEMQSVTKSYGDEPALTGCSLTLNTNEIVGLLGPNGSGKTTLMKLIAGLIFPGSGKILVHDTQPRLARGKIAWSAETEDLFAWMNAVDAAYFMKGMYPDFDEQKYFTLVEQLELTRAKRFASYSKGGRRRFKLALMLARNASLYLLDEPLSGIDIISREKILRVVAQARPPESCLVLSTHEFEGAEELLTRVVLLKGGHIAADRSTDSIRAAGGSVVDFYRGHIPMKQMRALLWLEYRKHRTWVVALGVFRFLFFL